MRRLIIITATLIISVQLHAQKERKSMSWYNEKTYDLYNESDWKALIQTGKDALKEGYDFYYLQMRLGIAYYELERYYNAARHFNAALEYYPEDELILEYLYYSLMFSGKTQEADLLLYRNKESLNKIGIEPVIDYKESFFEPGLTFNNNLDQNAELDLDGTQGNNRLGETEFIDNSSYFAMGFRHSVWPRINITYALNYININRISKVQRQDADLIDNRLSLSQNQFYIKMDVLLPWNIKLMGAYNAIKVDQNKFINTGSVFFPNYQLQDFGFDNSLFATGLSKNLYKFKLHLNYSLGDLNETDQEQINFGVEYYPFGNLNLYSVTDIYNHKNADETEILINQKIGAKVLDKVWFEAYGTFGKARNFFEDNAYIAYNTGKDLTFKWGSNIFYRIRPDLEIRLYFKNAFYDDEFYRLNGTQPVEINTYDYKSYSITGGIKWIF